MKVLITGGVRSGKTRYALRRAEAAGPARTYLATAQALDAEMAERIRRHREERGPGWTTVEEPLDIARHLGGRPVLVDCLTLWLTNLLLSRAPDAPVEADFADLAAAVRAADAPVFLVTNEVGMGIVPENALARRFRDEAGRLSQTLAAVCDEVVLCVAGLPLHLKGSEP